MASARDDTDASAAAALSTRLYNHVAGVRDTRVGLDAPSVSDGCVSYDPLARPCGVRPTSRDRMKSAITPDAYGTLQDAYDYFNARLWRGTLPDLLITLQRRRGAGGSFAPQRFRERRRRDAAAEAGPIRAVHELTLNPDAFTGRSDREVVAILVHEMVHTWQQEHGAPSRRGYHNRQWATEMQRIGLYPSSTGAPGGRDVGQAMSHYVIEDGLFATLWQELAASTFVLRWESATVSNSRERTRAAQRASKTKYTCRRCRTRAWAKPGVQLVCGRCSRPLALVALVVEDAVAEAARASA